MDASVFFTFYGLNIIHKDYERLLKIAALRNPAMPTPVPVPNLALGLPGMGAMATQTMKTKFRQKNLGDIGELLESAQELNVRLIARQMTLDVFGYEQGDFIDGVEFAGAGAFLAKARQAHVTLFIEAGAQPLRWSPSQRTRPQRQRTTSTGQLARWATRSLTLARAGTPRRWRLPRITRPAKGSRLG